MLRTFIVPFNSHLLGFVPDRLLVGVGLLHLHTQAATIVLCLTEAKSVCSWSHDIQLRFRLLPVLS